MSTTKSSGRGQCGLHGVCECYDNWRVGVPQLSGERICPFEKPELENQQQAYDLTLQQASDWSYEKTETPSKSIIGKFEHLQSKTLLPAVEDFPIELETEKINQTIITDTSVTLALNEDVNNAIIIEGNAHCYFCPSPFCVFIILFIFAILGIKDDVIVINYALNYIKTKRAYLLNLICGCLNGFRSTLLLFNVLLARGKSVAECVEKAKKDVWHLQLPIG
jgi:hypothetical protein